MKTKQEGIPGNGRVDGVLLTAVLLLCLIGLVMVYSSSAILAQDGNGSETSYLRSQAEKLAVGLVLLLVFAQLPVRLLYGRPSWWILGLGGLLLLLLLLPLGMAVEVRDTRRFLNLKVIQIQPSEFARLGLIVFLAYYLSHKEGWIGRSWRSLVVPVAGIGLPAAAIHEQPNLSSAVLLAGVGFILLFMAGHPVKRLLILAAPLAVVAALSMKGYQLGRIFSFVTVSLGGEASLPYQVKQSLIAIGTGGLFGQGIGQGLQKYHYLPFPHTDFILGIIGEEGGLAGVFVLFSLYGLVVLRGLRIARRAPDRFSGLLALGLTASVAVNFLLHSVVALGLGPVTGVPLPFVSHGGSSLLVHMIGMGMLLSISRQARYGRETVQETWKLPQGPLRTT